MVFGTALFVGAVMPRSAGLAGLALTSALSLTGLMNWMVRQTTELEVSLYVCVCGGGGWGGACVLYTTDADKDDTAE